MKKFLYIQYKKLHRLTKEQLHSYVPKWITEEEYNEIISEDD